MIGFLKTWTQKVSTCTNDVKSCSISLLCNAFPKLQIQLILDQDIRRFCTIQVIEFVLWICVFYDHKYLWLNSKDLHEDHKLYLSKSPSNFFLIWSVSSTSNAMEYAMVFSFTKFSKVFSRVNFNLCIKTVESSSLIVHHCYFFAMKLLH